MFVSTHTSLGEIIRVEQNVKGYTRVMLQVDIPFKRTYLTFIVWNLSKLNDNGKIMKIGDFVRASYHYKEQFPQLDQLNEVCNGYDCCPVCYSYTEAQDAQQIDCPGCAIVNDDEYKQRISEPMTLIAKVLNVYTYSSGYQVEFFNEKTKVSYKTVVFRNQPLFNQIVDMKIGGTYRVIGWKHKNEFKCNPIDLVDIFDN